MRLDGDEVPVRRPARVVVERADERRRDDRDADADGELARVARLRPEVALRDARGLAPGRRDGGGRRRRLGRGGRVRRRAAAPRRRRGDERSVREVRGVLPRARLDDVERVLGEGELVLEGEARGGEVRPQALARAEVRDGAEAEEDDGVEPGRGYTGRERPN